MAIRYTLSGLKSRKGPRPKTTRTNPHQQLSQLAPTDVQTRLFELASALPGVKVDTSSISLPDSRAFVLSSEMCRGPNEAFMVGREFAHIHPVYDGSLHMTLPSDVISELIEKGWGEPHPMVALGRAPPTAVMVFGPRDGHELEVVWRLLQISYAFATGEL